MWTRPGKKLLPLLLALLLLVPAGCRDQEESPSQDRLPRERAAEAALPAGERPAEGGELKVYALSAPESPASEEERERARGAVDYVSAADEALASRCGLYPFWIAEGVGAYRTSYIVPVFEGERPSASCLRRAVKAPKGQPEDVAAMLAAMDAAREAMVKAYSRLQDYVEDESVRDDGALGERLCAEIQERLADYVQTLERFRTRAEEEAESARKVLLRGHPLRDHVLLAGGVVARFRGLADRVAVDEPSPASLEEPLSALERELETARGLPFPLAGRPEMLYRAFLKAAGRLLELFRRGQAESFHEEVRRGLNEAWAACRKSCDAFLGAI